MAKKRCKTVIDMNELADSIGVSHPDDVWDTMSMSSGELYSYAYSEALEEGMSEEEAEEFAQRAEREELDEQMRQYVGAVESAAEYLYGQHKLVVTIPTKIVDGEEVQIWDKIRIEPAETWRAAAAEIMETINGVGMFHYWSVKEFLDSGPYTPCEAVMEHLGYIKRYPDVYGGQSAQGMVDSSMRYNNPASIRSVRSDAHGLDVSNTRKLKSKLLR
jgi:hypothetical protein